MFGEDGIAAVGGQHLNSRAGGSDDGGADEDRFEVAELGRKGDDARIQLAPVGVALDVDIHEPERLLCGGADTAGKEDGTGAGAEDGFGLTIGAEGLEEAFPMEDF